MRSALRYGMLFIALLLVSFGLPRALPGDPVATVTTGGAQDVPIVLSDQARSHLVAYYRLDLSLPQQLRLFLTETARGNLGYSISRDQSVSRLLVDRAPWTLLLIGPSLILAAFSGCFLGIVSAWRHGRRGERRLAGAILVLGSLPDFVIGIGLILLFGVWLPLLPTSGATSPFQACQGAAQMLRCASDSAGHVILPVLTLTAAQLPAFFLLMRASMLGELRQEYVLVARAKGLREATIATRHVARTALLPVITLLGLRLGAMLGGVVVVETLFAYPGLGQLAFQAALARDFPVLQAMLLLGGAAILLLNVAADVARARMDPRLGDRMPA